jgi:sugar diacid utilization regulator
MQDVASSLSADPWTGSAHSSPPTLRHVVDALGPVVLEVEGAGGGLDVPVGDVVIHDPVDPLEVQRGDVVLAVGIRPDEPGAANLVRRCGGVGAAAVVLRGPVADELTSVGEQAEVAVLAAAPEVSWGQLHALLRTAIGTAGRAVGLGDEGAPAGDLFALANAVATMVGGPVTIEDPQSRVLAFSNLGHQVDEPRRQTILGRRVPSEWVERLRQEGFFTRLWSSDDVVEYGGGGQQRLAIAVRAGDELLGSVWAADGGTPFKPSAHEAMREAAEMAALHLVRHRVGDDLDRRMRGELLRSLLDGRGSVAVLAQRLGADPSGRATLVAFELTGGDAAAVALARERVRELVVTYCESYRRRIAHVTMNGILYVLLLGGEPDAEVDELAVRLADDVVERIDASGAVLRAAVSSTVERLDDVPHARAEVERVLEVFTRYSFGRRSAHVDDVRAYTALLELERVVADQPHLRLPQLAKLAESDEEHGTPYLETLRAYLDAFGDVIQASQAIHVHANTFRYRLRRLIELSGLDLENPDERIVVEVQLRAR